MKSRCFQPELTWIDGDFHRNISITVEDGVITDVGEGDGSDAGAFLPGFVSTHSHAFQRVLRGKGETGFTSNVVNDSFWGWREVMYNIVDNLSLELFYSVCVESFAEMRLAGITTVGEFHYLHHDSETDYAFDRAVLDAASEAGIRIVLLHSCYMHGGFDAPLHGGQLRFATGDVDDWFSQVDGLASSVDGNMQRIGTAAHSLRAVDIDALSAVAKGAMHRGMPMHIHVEEQRQEISACIKKYGKTPMALLNESIEVSPMLTAIHCTHTAASDMEQWISRGGNICLCPLTEANLADGICDLQMIIRQGGIVSLGTDSNARISMIEEMRWMEYAQRLAREKRGVCSDAKGDMPRCLFDAATVHGARSLGIAAGAIETGKYADFAVLDLSHPQFAHVTDGTLAAAICCGADNAAINRTIVNGK